MSSKRYSIRISRMIADKLNFISSYNARSSNKEIEFIFLQALKPDFKLDFGISTDKSTKIQYQGRISENLYSDIQDLATSNGRSFNQEASLLVNNYISNFEKEHGKINFEK